MGDAKRFRLMADLIAQAVPNRDARIADIAGGHGHLQAALRKLGYQNVLSIDKRKKYAGSRTCYRYGLFEHDTPERFDLVVGMHPDEASDHIVIHGRDRKTPWIVCPCCVLPSAAMFGGRPNDYHAWVSHLRQLGGGPAKVQTVTFPMSGRNIVLLGNC